MLQAAVENAILERNLGQYDCVMLSSVARFTASEARVLGQLPGPWRQSRFLPRRRRQRREL